MLLTTFRFEVTFDRVAGDGPQRLGDGGSQEVTGSNAALLLWLARGDGAGVSSQTPLPVLPSWG